MGKKNYSSSEDEDGELRIPKQRDHEGRKYRSDGDENDKRRRDDNGRDRRSRNEEEEGDGAYDDDSRRRRNESGRHENGRKDKEDNDRTERDKNGGERGHEKKRELKDRHGSRRRDEDSEDDDDDGDRKDRRKYYDEKDDGREDSRRGRTEKDEDKGRRNKEFEDRYRSREDRYVSSDDDSDRENQRRERERRRDADVKDRRWRRRDEGKREREREREKRGEDEDTDRRRRRDEGNDTSKREEKERKNRREEEDNKPGKEREVDVGKANVEPNVVQKPENLGRSGGVYIPPFKLARMMKEVEDKSSLEYQRMTWDALRKSINGLVNKVNAINIKNIIPELFAENLIRGRGLFCRSCMKSQMASPGFTDVFAALVAVANTKFPELGELLLKRVILQLQRAYKRNDKPQLLAAVKFIAHLVNQQVVHELIALELLTILLENPTDDSVEVAVGFVTECGSMLQDLCPRGLHGQ